MSFFAKIFGNTQHTQSVKKFEPMVARINAFEYSIKALSDLELKAKTAEFKERLKKVSEADFGKEALGNALSELLPEAFAVVREAAKRTLGQRHFDVQLIGGMVLNSGAISEMRTGEGKTLVATLPAYLNALTGKGIHIVTVNDYLSRRDAVWMGQIYDFLGLSVGVINHESSFLYDPKIISPTTDQPRPSQAATSVDFDGAKRSQTKTLSRAEEGEADALDEKRDETGAFHVVHEFLRPCTRREAYAADITYGTNNEFGFDYLRDNLEYSPSALRQREPNYAIVDEIDSILIDEARTPLIISAPTRDADGR